MSKNPRFNYTELVLQGFKKYFQNLVESNPDEVANWLYTSTSAFSGRDGKCICGGGEGDIRNLICAASGENFEVPEARKVKKKLRTKLRQAWLENDHVTIYDAARGFERGASMKTIDYRTIAWADPCLFSIDEDEILTPESVEVWIDVFTEVSETRSMIGNKSRKRLRRKSADQMVKSLFEGDAV